MAKTTMQIRLDDADKVIYKQMATLSRRSLSSWVLARLRTAANADAKKAKMKPPFTDSVE